ncbi:flagellar basal-body rod protein FlgC [Kineosporia sp. NBRC 101677]|uniref:flagellar basal body rod protein FlgC n=1 Tax=Kineosporia sp. NBRC 101677 TaxID=3032197 RepID=UPI0024A406D4|nr:flagellar basal body rod protein FlgC [Kineosporia sp. NBRC 101677]GLY13946.1 flagellar basal-body rod protein FlgC [Kineosporia sp. NBRC 101677]
MFDSLTISGSGMYVHQNWMDAVSDNIANVNTVRPSNEDAFQARYVIAQSIEDGQVGAGVRVAGVELGDATGRLVYSPEHPYADAQGYVRQPDIDLGDQMTQMIMAQRGFQANSANLDRVRAAYQAAIQMGRS